MDNVNVIIKRSNPEYDDDSLFHSDIFLGDEFDDEMYHWKYIKKKRVNGKWRYYYDVKDALGYDERGAAGDAVREYNRAKTNADNYNKIQSDPTRVKWYNQSKSDQMYKDAAKAGKKASEALKKYYKTPLGKIDRLDDKIDSGRRAVSKLLNKLAKKIQPKDEHITKYSVKNSK